MTLDIASAIAALQLMLFAIFVLYAYTSYRRAEEERKAEEEVDSMRDFVSVTAYKAERTSQMGLQDDVNSLNVDLTEDEARVLKFLLEKGSETYQAEIARGLNMPKSTVSRIIRRLSERGLVEVRRVGRYSYVQVVNPDFVRELLVRKGLS